MSLLYETRRPNNAIAEFSATLRFAGPASPVTFPAIAEALKQCAKILELPAPMNIQVLNFQFGGGGVAPQAPPPLGMGYQRFSPTGEIECALQCDNSSVTFSTTNYESWVALLPTIVSSFNQIGIEYLKEVPAIHSISIQYVNEFKARDPSTVSTDGLFAPDSVWIAPFADSIGDPWHCHIGRFLTKDKFRHLINVNCDVARNNLVGDTAVFNFARVLMMVSNVYDLDGVGPLMVERDTLGSSIEGGLNAAHDMQCEIMGGLFSEEVLNVIGHKKNG